MKQVSFNLIGRGTISIFSPSMKGTQAKPGNPLKHTGIFSPSMKGTQAKPGNPLKHTGIFSPSMKGSTFSRLNPETR